jgi:hypothetical protein
MNNITIEQFTQRHGFTNRDSFAACKMYKGQSKTVEEWDKILKKDFTFTSTIVERITEFVKIEPEKTTEKVKLVKKSQTKKV